MVYLCKFKLGGVPMNHHFPTLMERPDNGNIFASLIYEVVAYFSVPFLLLLLLQGAQNDGKIVSVIEVAYHALNFFVALFIYREYLTDTFADIRYNFKRLLHTSSVNMALILLYVLVLHALFGMDRGITNLLAYGGLPLTEVELFILPSSLVLTRPVLGTLCLVFLAPLAISCLYYATVFAPICYTRPVLAYVAVAAFLAFPRFCNASTYWDPVTEWTLYFTQLPIHLLACRSYQMSDSIWAPILTHTVVNAIACGLLIFARFTAIL